MIDHFQMRFVINTGYIAQIIAVQLGMVSEQLRYFSQCSFFIITVGIWPFISLIYASSTASSATSA